MGQRRAVRQQRNSQAAIAIPTTWIALAREVQRMSNEENETSLVELIDIRNTAAELARQILKATDE